MSKAYTVYTFIGPTREQCGDLDEEIVTRKNKYFFFGGSSPKGEGLTLVGFAQCSLFRAGGPDGRVIPVPLFRPTTS